MNNANNGPILRAYVEKRNGFDAEAERLKGEFIGFLSLETLDRVRILHRYDVSGLNDADFSRVASLVFAELQCDELHLQAEPPMGENDRAVAVEYLPGQYDQRSDSAEQCAQLVVGKRPRVRTARLYILSGRDGEAVSEEEIGKVATYLVNPVDSRLASLDLPESLDPTVQEPPEVPILAGFRDLGEAAVAQACKTWSLAMSAEDLLFCRDYFRDEERDPTLAELRVLDTYWSDHCRHTTFTTRLDEVSIGAGADGPRLKRAWELYEGARIEYYGEEKAATRPKTLMDLATLGAKVLRKRGLLEDLDVSEEINACSVKVQARFDDGTEEPWLLMFKNETHNHPTEIEPFGGAATCLGGAIRDPLSGRSYVHQAMRVTGGADPRAPLSETLNGKLPQVKIAREAAAGYSSYGNQIGLATGQVSEFYHGGFMAKRMELGAVIGAAPEAHVRREEPLPGDLVILVGGRTGRDGIGGATGSSKAHTEESVQTAGAEVQKGNAVEERKLQRLFRKENVTTLIKRCNDFGAGGVSVAIGELARGLNIDLDSVPKKYEGLDGVELAIAESQERMAVVTSPSDAAAFIAQAAEENLEATVVAVVTDNERLRMSWRGATVVDLDRNFLDKNGAPRSAVARMAALPGAEQAGSEAAKVAPAGMAPSGDPSPEALMGGVISRLGSAEYASRRGLQERFDGSIGAASVLFPWGGSEQGTPECGMAALLPALGKESLTASLMSFGYDPELSCQSPYVGAQASILEALAKLACLGGDPFRARLSLQEYFPRTDSPEAWGKPLEALLGAFEAQLALEVPAIGGKDSMSGTYSDPATGTELKVPSTLVAFAAGSGPAKEVRSGALSGPGGSIALFAMGMGLDGGADWKRFRRNVDALRALTQRGFVRAAYPVSASGLEPSLALTAFGSLVGLELDGEALTSTAAKTPGAYAQVVAGGAVTRLPAGSFFVELDPGAFTSCARDTEQLLASCGAALIGRTVAEPVFRIRSTQGGAAERPLAELRQSWEAPLAKVYPQTSTGTTVAEGSKGGATLDLPKWTSGLAAPRRRDAGAASPLVVLPTFPGTNCEWDMERAFRRAGARTKVVVFRNRTPEETAVSIRVLAAAIEEAQILALSGGFSAGDEPDGSGKFIANVLREGAVADAVTGLLEARDGLAIGICNGFQALIKVGLVPYGSIRNAESSMPTLTFNSIGRHVSRMVRTAVMSNRSPWLALDEVGSVRTIPVSHGEGRLAICEAEGRRLFAEGLVATCYVDAAGHPTMEEPDNPNGSAFAVEGLLSPDGRVLGKMAHSERVGPLVHRNIPGEKVQRIFEAGVRYFA